MDRQQPSSGDLRDIQKQHALGLEKSQSNHSSDGGTSPVKPPSLLERRQSNQIQKHNNAHPLEEEFLGDISPMPTGAERMAALRDLGATFEEGQRSIAKVATPTETVVPSFVDSDQLEGLLHKRDNPNLTDTCNNTVAR
ncbi:uncharacterized protein ATC70_004408 [Mucor velutinosus]|uniref:Uncharacterized protein n=1 Tax=Mucor velutinosus TaxID=708070 RepID=A0AAN7HWY3_9FUNG|nr:hypothetical protein ATC70_004408 [Mucor velutinosus]